MDLVRHCYKTKMRLWRDSDVLTPVYWHRARPEAKLFDQMSGFRSSYTWTRHDRINPKVGEINKDDHEYYKGQNPAMYKGLKHCGSDLAMRRGGVHGTDKEILTGQYGKNPCCGDIPPPNSCIPTPTGSVDVTVPATIRLRLLNNGNCPGYAGMEFPMTFRGRAGFTVDGDPVPQTYMPFSTCAYWYASAFTFVTDLVGFTTGYVAWGVGFLDHWPDGPVDCELLTCAKPYLWWKEWILNEFGDIQYQQERSTGNPEVVLVEADPFRLQLRREVNVDSALVVCQLGNDPPTDESTIFDFTA